MTCRYRFYIDFLHDCVRISLAGWVLKADDQSTCFACMCRDTLRRRCACYWLFSLGCVLSWQCCVQNCDPAFDCVLNGCKKILNVWLSPCFELVQKNIECVIDPVFWTGAKECWMYGSSSCVLNWCERVLNVWFVLCFELVQKNTECVTDPVFWTCAKECWMYDSSSCRCVLNWCKRVFSVLFVLCFELVQKNTECMIRPVFWTGAKEYWMYDSSCVLNWCKRILNVWFVLCFKLVQKIIECVIRPVFWTGAKEYGMYDSPCVLIWCKEYTPTLTYRYSHVAVVRPFSRDDSSVCRQRARIPKVHVPRWPNFCLDFCPRRCRQCQSGRTDSSCKLLI